MGAGRNYKIRTRARVGGTEVRTDLRQNQVQRSRTRPGSRLGENSPARTQNNREIIGHNLVQSLEWKSLKYGSTQVLRTRQDPHTLCK